MLIDNNCPELPSKDNELSLNTFNDIGELPELKKFKVNVEAPTLPKVPLTKFKDPDTPSPDPTLTFPLTPMPPATTNEPDVEEVDCVLKLIPTPEEPTVRLEVPDTEVPHKTLMKKMTQFAIFSLTLWASFFYAVYK